MKNLLLTAALIAASTTASANEVVKNVKIFDHTKTITRYTPVTTYKCADIKKPVYGNVRKEGDAAGSALLGMIIGGVLGNNVTKNVDNGGAVGALLGGMLGHSNSKSTGGTRQVCNIETRYNESRVEVYSHSVVTFRHNGKMYSLKFQK